jgi:pimeloyl-ACP methyl ester carboxylesterase
MNYTNNLCGCIIAQLHSVSAWNKLMPSQEHYVPTVDGERVHLWLMLQPQAMTGQQAQDSKQREQSPVSPAASSSSSYSGNGVPTILFFHGNAGNIGYRLPTATDLYKHVQCNVVLVEYRGFGNSSGRPSQVGFTQDAQSVLQWALAHPNIDSSCIFVYGRSLGGAVSVALCQKSQQFVRGLVLENTFTSITDMAHELAKKIDNKVGRGSGVCVCVCMCAFVVPSCLQKVNLYHTIVFIHTHTHILTQPCPRNSGSISSSP